MRRFVTAAAAWVAHQPSIRRFTRAVRRTFTLDNVLDNLLSIALLAAASVAVTFLAGLPRLSLVILVGSCALVGAALFHHQRQQPRGEPRTTAVSKGPDRVPSASKGIPGWVARHDRLSDCLDLSIENVHQDEIHGFRVEVTTLDRPDLPYVAEDVTREEFMGAIPRGELPRRKFQGSFVFPFEGMPKFSELAHGRYFVEWYGYQPTDEWGVTVEPVLLRQYAFDLGPGGTARRVEAAESHKPRPTTDPNPKGYMTVDVSVAQEMLDLARLINNWHRKFSQRFGRPRLSVTPDVMANKEFEIHFLANFQRGYDFLSKRGHTHDKLEELYGGPTNLEEARQIATALRSLAQRIMREAPKDVWDE